jgi:pimeloyl-ACP methyl ester carboxylesterase
MEMQSYPAVPPGAFSRRILLVMLPGAGIAVDDFAKHGMVDAVQEGGDMVDVITVRPALDSDLDGDIAAELQANVIQPALAQGYQRIWLLGISLGGMGALLYASHHAAQLEGIILLAPFLGTQGTIAEIASAGGLTRWCAQGSNATPSEHGLLTWLQEYSASPPARPVMYLGYGNADRFALGHRLLAAILPQHRVMQNDGAHDWPSWLELCRQIIAALPFAMNGAGNG